jgi:glucosyl-3-phosphoglycerate synthase
VDGVSIVVIPARDEEARIGACLQALAAQTVGTERFEVLLVLDACTDDTERVAVDTATALGVSLRVASAPEEGAGAARRMGMDAAAARLYARDEPHGLIACTDADSRPHPTWLERQLRHLSAGAKVVAGMIELDPREAAALPPGVLDRRDRDAALRLRSVHACDHAAEHHHFAGASLGITADAYLQVGGLEPLVALEDAAFAVRLREHGIPILRARDVCVRTSARADGRARRGLSVDLAVSGWLERRRYRSEDFPLNRIAGHKDGRTVTVIIPTRQCGSSIGAVLRDTVGPLLEVGLLDEVVVVDAGSDDDTAEHATAAGARVLHQDRLLGEFGPALGKGDAMWRALSATRGDVVCFLDGDTLDPDPRHLQGLLGPILCEPSLSLVKGTFDRPLRTGETELAHEGGRVTELMARPLLNLHEPQLAGFTQPLAGEFAASRSLLESLPFPVGYGVEIALLIDTLRASGLDAIAECHLGVRRNRHQPLRALGEMAYAVLAAVERRSGQRSPIGGHYLRPWHDGEIVTVPVLERPPLMALQPKQIDSFLAESLTRSTSVDERVPNPVRRRAV